MQAWRERAGEEKCEEANLGLVYTEQTRAAQQNNAGELFII